MSLNYDWSNKMEKFERKGNFILRQEMVDITPSFTLKCTLVFNLLSFFLLLALNIPLLIAETSISETAIDYTDWWLIKQCNTYVQVQYLLRFYYRAARSYLLRVDKLLQKFSRIWQISHNQAVKWWEGRRNRLNRTTV